MQNSVSRFYRFAGQLDDLLMDDDEETEIGPDTAAEYSQIKVQSLFCSEFVKLDAAVSVSVVA